MPDPKSPDPKSKIYEFQGAELMVKWDLRRCIHAAACVSGLPAVFDAEKRPWVEPDNASVQEVVDVVMKCPSGALHAEPSGAGPAEPKLEANTVGVAPDGPLYVAGDITINLASGTEIRENRIALCRCGGSANKPLCDGTHATNEFSDSGTLGESKMGDGEVEGTDLSISPAPNGPLIASGPLTVSGPDSEDQSGTRCALCRCGASSNKPYCDGSHKDIGFTTG